MQARESSVSEGTDPPPLLGGVAENSTESGEGDGLDATAVASIDSGGHRQRIEDRLLSRFNCCSDERVYMGIGQLGQCVGSVFRIMRDDVRGREGQHKVSAAMLCRGTCARQTQRGTLRQPRELAAIERSIGGNNDDDRAFTLSWQKSLCDGRNSLIEPTDRNASNNQFRPSPVVRIDEHANRIAAFGLW